MPFIRLVRTLPDDCEISPQSHSCLLLLAQSHCTTEVGGGSNNCSLTDTFHLRSGQGISVASVA